MYTVPSLCLLRIHIRVNVTVGHQYEFWNVLSRLVCFAVTF
jgi:hypothetical protein